MNTHLDDQRQAAEAELDALTASVRAGAQTRTIDTTAESLAQQAFLLDQADRCMHLVERPIQPTMALIGHGFAVADCVDCFLARRGRVRQCTSCGHEARRLQSVLLEVGHRLAVSLLCHGCFERVEALT